MTHVIHPSSIVVSREHRRAKTDRLDTELLMRAFLGWLRGEPRHRTMAAVPTIDEEDARRPSREREKLVGERTRIVNRMQRCAIYTRKSTEHNLDLEFNSLDAQREACEAYIKSHGRAIVEGDVERVRPKMMMVTSWRDCCHPVATARVRR